MEVDNYVLSLQRVMNIKSSFLNFDPEKDMGLLKEIANSIRSNCPFLDEESSIQGTHAISRKIHIVLFLHAEFETSKYYVEQDDVACVVGIVPQLNPVFYLLLVDKLKLNEYLKELIFYSSEVVSNNILDVVSKTIKFYELDETLELYESIIKIIFLKLKYLELGYQEKCGNIDEAMGNLKIDNKSETPIADDQQTIKAKYLKFIQNFKTFGFEFCNSLLGSYKVKSFDTDEAVIFEGYLVLSHVQLLIFCTNVECFQNNGENPDVNSKPCISMTQDIQEFYKPFNESEDFNYCDQWKDSSNIAEVDLFQDCFVDLLYDLMKVLTPINTDKWLAFHEHRVGGGKTLQTTIGEQAYHLNELLKKAQEKGYEHTNVKQVTETYLQHLCIKPISEEDLILKSLPEELISAFKEHSDVIKTRSRWLDSALRFFGSQRFHEEIMTIFESNLQQLSCATVYCLHDMIMDRLQNEELGLSRDDTLRLKQLLLSSLDHLSLADQIKVVRTFVEKYAEELCTVFESEEQRGEANEWLNMIDNQSSLQEVCSTSLKHIMQAPASTLHKLMSLGLKCKLDQSCLTLIIKCLADYLLPHFGGVDLYPDSQGGCFLLDYLLDVFEQVKLSMESGVVSFITSEEVGELRPTEDENQLKNLALDLNSLNKLSQQDVSNIKPMIALLFEKKVLSPSDLYEKVLLPNFNVSDDHLLYEYLSFVTDVIMLYFEDSSEHGRSLSNEQLGALLTQANVFINLCTCPMNAFIKEKYFARERLILLLTSLLKNHKDSLDLSSVPHSDWLKLLLTETSTPPSELFVLNDVNTVPFLCRFLSQASQAEWTSLVTRLPHTQYLPLINVMLVLVRLVESRTNDPHTVEPFVNSLHQIMMCFSNVFKDIVLPTLLKSSGALSVQYKLDLFESLSFLLACFQSEYLDQVKMFVIMSLEGALCRIVEKLFTPKEVKGNERALFLNVVRIDFVNTRVKLVQSVQSCAGLGLG